MSWTIWNILSCLQIVNHFVSEILWTAVPSCHGVGEDSWAQSAQFLNDFQWMNIILFYLSLKISPTPKIWRHLMIRTVEVETLERRYKKKHCHLSFKMSECLKHSLKFAKQLRIHWLMNLAPLVMPYWNSVISIWECSKKWY